MSSNGGAERFPCPKGCGKDFKTNSAAHAHSIHCKFIAPVEPDPEDTIDNPAGVEPELSEAEMAIYNRVAGFVGAQVEQGIAGLQVRVQESLLAGLGQALPQMVEDKVGEGIVKFVESLKNPAQPAAGADPGTTVATAGNGRGTSGLGDLMALAGQLNDFLDTNIGKILYNKFFKGGAAAKGNWKEWARGHSMAVRMLGANKSDSDATALMIKEMTGPYKAKTGNDLLRGMNDAAEMWQPSKKGVTAAPPPEVKKP